MAGRRLSQERPVAVATLSMRVRGKRPVSFLITRLSGLDGIHEVGTIGDERDLE